MSRDRRGMVLLQVVFVVFLMAMWASVGLSRAAEALRRVIRAEEVVRVEEGVVMELETLLVPPDLAALCLAGPRQGFKRIAARPDGVTVVIRWRHLGAGTVLAEIDGTGATGARIRAIAWLTPESLERTPTGLLCTGVRLRQLGPGSVVPRPGE